MRLLSRLLGDSSGPRRPSRVGALATDLRGTSPDGASAEISVAAPRLVVFFLTTSCVGCRVIWQFFEARPADGSVAWPVALVTPSPSTESVRAVAALSPDGVPVLMSSEAWQAYAVTGAPWCVVVAGGEVVFDAPAPANRKQLQRLLAAEQL